MTRERFVVGLARLSNVYGGPEEGGWYYDAGHPLAGKSARVRTFYREESARAYQEALQGIVDAADRFPGVGMGGCGDDDGLMAGEVFGDGVRAVMQEYPKRSRQGLLAWPEYTPHYE